jgi:hypothetical protein
MTWTWREIGLYSGSALDALTFAKPRCSKKRRASRSQFLVKIDHNIHIVGAASSDVNLFRFSHEMMNDVTWALLNEYLI